MSNPSEPVRLEVESVVDAIEEKEEENPVETLSPNTDEATTMVVEPINDDPETC